MQLLLDIDVDTDKNSGIGAGFQEKPGVPAEEVTFLGNENVFNFKSIKDHYDALGSYIHMPTPKKIEKNGSHNLDKLRNRCEKIVSALEAALSSPVFNITIGAFSEMPCLRCGEKVRQRLPLSGDDVEAKCFTCGAEYKITGNHSDETGMWQALYEYINRPTEQRDSRLRIWKDQAKEGMRLSCGKRGRKYRVGLAMIEDC